MRTPQELNPAASGGMTRRELLCKTGSTALLLSALSIGLEGCGGGTGSALLPGTPFSEATRAKLDSALSRSRAALGIPGVVASLFIPGEGLWESSVGIADKQTQQPMVAGMHTRIGSITKTFVVTAILQLADEKSLNLGDPVAKYLDFVPNGANITLRMLANMTSGLFSYTSTETWLNAFFQNPQRRFTARELLDYGFNNPQKFSFEPPGSSIEYCNSNTLILGLVVEKVSGIKIEDFVAQRILAPLGLNNTSWPTNASMPSPLAHGYTEQTLDDREVDSTFWDPSWGGAAGMMISDLEDMKVWARALGEGTLLSAEMQRERLTWAPYGSPTFKYGVGIGYYHGWIGHTGSLPGYNTAAFYLPQKRAVLVVQTNTDTRFVITPGNPPVSMEPVIGIIREITKIVTPDDVPDGYDFLDEEFLS
ncbi:MAG: serine hydrolase domain-containing protein [Armatimonadota bacterium]